MHVWPRCSLQSGKGWIGASLQRRWLSHLLSHSNCITATSVLMLMLPALHLVEQEQWQDNVQKTEVRRSM